MDESCGKCTPCRVGTKRLLEILNKITSGNGTLEDIDKMEELCYYIKENSLCGLGQTAPNPVLSTLKYYRDEYEAHVVEHRCPAGPARLSPTTPSSPTSARAAPCAPGTALWALFPALSSSPTSSTPPSASSAASAWRSVSSALW